MDINELFSCCRKGDLEKIRFLVEQRDVDVNVRDKWDSTPLYYACLCGHNSVVEYLIGVGARCEANTFDGERCLYGALTDEIRKTLTQHNLITAHTIRRDAFSEFLRRIYESGEESDVSIIVNGREFKLHRCILSARSSYFSDMFSSRWLNRRKIYVNNDLVDPTAFEKVMKYIYTGRFECSLEMTDICLTVANNCKLPKFKPELDEAIHRAKFLQIEKQGRVQITMVVIEPEDSNNGVETDFRELVQSTLPPELRVWPTEMPFCHREIPVFADVCFIVQGLQFMCHKVFFCHRSEYFKALIKDHFNETQWYNEDSNESCSIPILTLHRFSIEVFTVLISYLYTNVVEVTEETAQDVLNMAEMCLLPGLKRQCGVSLGTCITTSNAFYFHDLARMFSLPRLEDQCVAFVARNFTQMSHMQELRDIIEFDAKAINEREETDSVTFVDELRFHITSNLCSISDIEGAREKLSSLEEILEDLGIEA